jgi:hypothetical protein
MRIVSLVALAALVPLLSSGARAADAVASGNGDTLSLGSNWGPYETYRGASFRWIDNDAEIVLRAGAGESRVAIACEGGPSLGRRSFPLRILDASHHQIDHVDCNGADRRTEMLLPTGAGVTRYVLHVDGGGRPVPGERRILNFRVFSIDDERSAQGGGDVVDPRSGVRFGDGWYPVERYKGQTFRWMENGARVYVASDRATGGTLRMLLEVGPSVGAPAASVSVRDRHGRVVLRSSLRGRSVLAVPLQLEPGENEVTLDVQSANKPVPNDRRILNLRVFSASAQR